MEDGNEPEFKLVLAFDSDHPEFTRGFEAGMLYMSMGDKHVTKINQLIHDENAEMVIRMSEALGWDFVAQDMDNGWFQITLTRKS